jgi:hypothetical protein
VKREQRRLFRALNVIDEGNREVLGIEVATSIPRVRQMHSQGSQS